MIMHIFALDFKVICLLTGSNANIRSLINSLKQFIVIAFQSNRLMKTVAHRCADSAAQVSPSVEASFSLKYSKIA
jgi:hypothetical protein